MSEAVINVTQPDIDDRTFHITPVPDEPVHRLDGFCWCLPSYGDVLPGPGRIYIHRRTLDSPHIETDPPVENSGYVR